MKKIIYLVCTLFLFLSCREEALFRQTATDGEPLTVKFSLSSGAMEESLVSGTPTVSGNGVELSGTLPVTTRIGAEEGLIAQEQVIGEVVVAQFDGTTDDAVLVGTPQYVGNYVDETFDATLTVSTDPNTVVFIANTGDMTASITSGMTLAQLKMLTHSIPDEIIVENKDLPMVGIWTGVVSITSLNANNQIVKVPMQRVMAKIVLTVNNQVSDLNIDKVYVNNVPTSVGLYTPQEATNFTSYTVTKYQGELDVRYIWYMPENVSATTNTQVDIYASKEGKTYIYTSYLNVDEGDDYTVKRNTMYNLTVTIKRLTDAVTEADFTFDAHGTVHALTMKEYPRKKLENYADSYTMSGVVMALNSSSSETAIPGDADKCKWIQVGPNTTTVWNTGLKYLQSFSGSKDLYAFVNENLSTESRKAKIRLRYDRIYIKPPSGAAQATSLNLILTVEQKGCTLVGPFGGYDSGTGSYTKQLVMETIEEDESPMSWAVARTKCNEKFYNTADRRWYLPSQAQLTAIWLANYDSKEALKDAYWSATDNADMAWGMDMSLGVMKSESQSATKKVRCVRDVDSTDI